MSFFDFPTWAQSKLGDKKPEADPAQKMPHPTLDEIDAMQQAPRNYANQVSDNAIDAGIKAMVGAPMPHAPKKLGRPAKAKL